MPVDVGPLQAERLAEPHAGARKQEHEPDIPGQSSGTAEWLIQGDDAGEYQLSTDHRGMLDPFQRAVHFRSPDLAERNQKLIPRAAMNSCGQTNRGSRDRGEWNASVSMTTVVTRGSRLDASRARISRPRRGGRSARRAVSLGGPGVRTLLAARVQHPSTPAPVLSFPTSSGINTVVRMSPEEEERLIEHERTYWWHVVKRLYCAAILRRFRVLAATPAPLVLDVGAGGGASDELFASGTRLVLAETGLHAGFRAAPSPFKVVCVAEHMPFRSGVFDLVVAADVLEHIEDDHAAAREIARILRPAAHALVTVPAYPSLFSSHDEALGHFRRYTRRTLREVLGSAGFRPRFVSALFASLLPAVALRRILSPRGAARPTSSYVEVFGWINRACTTWFRLEALALRFIRLPLGSSLCILACTPPAPVP